MAFPDFLCFFGFPPATPCRWRALARVMSCSEKLGPVLLEVLLLPDLLADFLAPDLFLRLFPPESSAAPRPLIFLDLLFFPLLLDLFLRLLPPNSFSPLRDTPSIYWARALTSSLTARYDFFSSSISLGHENIKKLLIPHPTNYRPINHLSTR